MKRNISGGRGIARLPLDWKPKHRSDLIRLGSEHDGGYVVTETAVRGTGVLVGLGVGCDWAFEEEFHRIAGCAVHCYDHTVGFHIFLKAAYLLAKAYLRGRVPLDKEVITLPFKYRKFFSGRRRHYIEKVGAGPDSSDLKKIFSRIPESETVFMKIDIEGWEYSILSGVLEYSPRITGLVVEFHHVSSLGRAVESGIRELSECFDIVHVHANNHDPTGEDGIPMTIEVTFENKSLREGASVESGRDYPVEGLDSPNNSSLPDYLLEFY